MKPLSHALACKELICTSEQHRLLGPISLSFFEGRTAILGANGSGKSTLLRALAGVQPTGLLTEGQIVYQAQLEARTPIEFQSHNKHQDPVVFQNQLISGAQPKTQGTPWGRIPSARRAREIAWLAQDSQTTRGSSQNSFQTSLLTVQGLVEMAGLARQGWMSKIDTTTRGYIEEAIEAFDLSGLRHQLLQNISGGELQRAQLARIFAVRSPIMLLDEPDNHLDLKHLSHLENAMSESGARCIIYSTHDLNFALKADHLVLLQGGLTPEQFDLAQVSDDTLEKSLSSCFESPVKIIRHERLRSVLRA